MVVTTKFNIDLASGGATRTVSATQGEQYSRKLQAILYENGMAWVPPSGTAVSVAYKKSDGKGGEYDSLPNGDAAFSISGNIVTIDVAPQVLATAGHVSLAVGLYNGESVLYVFPIDMIVEPNPAQNALSDDTQVSGVKNIYFNGTYNVSEYEYAAVQVGGSGATATLQTKDIVPAASAQIVSPDAGYDGFSSVTVLGVNLQEKTATPSEEEQTIEPDEGYVGLSKVVVEASEGAGVAKAENVYFPPAEDTELKSSYSVTSVELVATAEAILEKASSTEAIPWEKEKGFSEAVKSLVKVITLASEADLPDEAEDGTIAIVGV